MLERLFQLKQRQDSEALASITTITKTWTQAELDALIATGIQDYLTIHPPYLTAVQSQPSRSAGTIYLNGFLPRLILIAIGISVGDINSYIDLKSDGSNPPVTRVGYTGMMLPAGDSGVMTLTAIIPPEKYYLVTNYNASKVTINYWTE